LTEHHSWQESHHYHEDCSDVKRVTEGERVREKNKEICLPKPGDKDGDRKRGAPILRAAYIFGLAAYIGEGLELDSTLACHDRTLRSLVEAVDGRCG